jgi:hypothetical protein
MRINNSTISWLLEGDPAIQWQVQKDLLDAEPAVYLSLQQQVAEKGWGAKLLKRQDASGTWGGGLYSPKWISTTYTLLTLRYFGLPSNNVQAQKGCSNLLEGGFQPDGGIHYARSKVDHSETCITGMVLSILSHFNFNDEHVHILVKHLLKQQMKDGGWNCRSYYGDSHSSFHTTISVLEGLWEYEKTFGIDPRIDKARTRAHEFILIHRLFRSHRTGEIFDRKMLTIPFPPRWRYDYLRCLDYFQNCQASRDERIDEAIDILQSRRKNDGRWMVNSGMSGLKFFEIEKAGQPSRINTLRALRVLKWWEDG